MEKQRISLREILPLIVLVILSVAIIIAIVFGTKREKLESKYFYEYFDTVSTVYAYTDDAYEFNRVSRRVGELLRYYHELFDIYSEGDARGIKLINDSAGADAVEVEEEVVRLLLYSKEIYRLTGGEVNVAMGSVLSIWHEYRDTGVGIPTEEELLAAAEHTDIDSIIIDVEAMTVRISDPLCSIDVGAVAKGYATERIAEELEAMGAFGYALDIGGNLRVIGEKSDGSGWRTGVRNPDTSSDEQYVHYLDARDTSVVTSGDYERYYTVDGVRYHHLIDKDTLMPSRYFSSVTVVCRDSALADALSTALFNTDMESGKRMIADLQVDSVIWVDKDGTVTVYDKPD